MKNTQKGGFTLVELIVVIVILTILGTIAFISFQGYSQSSRDAVRSTDLSNIKKALELFAVEKGIYPPPSNSTPMTFSGGTVWAQGSFGDSVFTNIGKLNKKPTDPLVGSEYTYSVTEYGMQYEVATVFESDTSVGLFPQVHAAGNILGTAYITGNYNGIITKVFTGSLTYVLTVPTIITSDILDTDVQSMITNKKLVYKGLTLLPSSYSGSSFISTPADYVFSPSTIIAYTGTSVPTTEDELSQMMYHIQSVYEGTSMANHPDIQKILAINIYDSDALVNLGTEIISKSVGQDLNPSTITLATCAGVSDGLIGLWHLDSDWTDSSGNNHTMTPKNGATFAGGQIGTAASFDGVDDYAEDLNGPSYLNGLGSASISVWIKADVIGTNRGILYTKDPDNSDSPFSLRYDVSGIAGGGANVIKTGIGAKNGTIYNNYASVYESKSMVQTTKWQHLVVTWSANEAPKLYINGVLDTTTYSTTNGSIIGDVDKLFIGQAGQGLWDGLIDETAIYNRALSEYEIGQIYNKGLDSKAICNP